MKLASRTLLQLLGSTLLVTPLAAQLTCPRASGPDAEAGRAAYGQGDIGGAETRFTAALTRCPDDRYAQTGLGYVRLRQGRDDRATELWTSVVAAEPDNVDALTGLGLAAWRQGDVEAVRARFGHVLELVPDHPTALDYLARVTLSGPMPERPPLVLPDTLVYPARTHGDRFEIRGPGGRKPFYIKGVDLGAALPGRHPGEFPDSLTYARWIRQMADMNVNVVRIYTIHPPEFYRALSDWNTQNPDRSLWLIHGVWSELLSDHDFAAPAFESEFFREMRRVVDLVHGRADIQPRPGHASGYYTADVSRWTLAYIIGREWEPFSAEAFDSIEAGRGGFEGRYLTVHGGNAMDAWLGRAVDEIAGYETETYRAQRPVAYTNWPTLDPLLHATESTVDEEMAMRRAVGEHPTVRDREYDNDAFSLDASLVTPTDRLRAGSFASFHAYPYYPDFIVLDRGYGGAASSAGRSNYFGYLHALKEHHPNMPVVISEYGAPASLGTGHLQPQGWHHGGLTEREVAHIDTRLTKEIAEAGMAGGIAFSWIDEWFERTWVTTEFELPTDRNRLWYNRLDAEQHYGMIALEAEPPVAGGTLHERMHAWAQLKPLYEEPALTVRVASDAAHLWLLVHPYRSPDEIEASAAEGHPMRPHVPQEDPADEAWRNGNTKLARQLYEERLAANPNDDVALHRLALLHAWAEEYDQAHQLFNRLLELEPDNLDARVDRDRAWAWAGETNRALDDLSEILEAYPDHPRALEARALFEAWAGRYEESLSNYEQLVAIAPDNGAARRQQAQVLTWASRFDASRAVYDSLLADDPDDVESRLGLANVLTLSDELDEAVAEYDRILAVHPDDVRALQGKGRALAWGNHLVEGEMVFRHAVDLEGTNTASLVGLAQVLRWQDRNAAALDVLHRAEALAPTDNDVREQLRAVNLALSPLARPGFVWETDSDNNQMLTSSLSAAWHPTPRLDVRADGYRRDLQQGALQRSAMGVMVTASYQLEPGWTLTAGGGGSRTDATGRPSFLAYRMGVQSPPRHVFTAGLAFDVSALDATALLAERRVKATSGTATGRWTPASGWRVDAALGLARFFGTQENDRRNGFLSVSSRVGGSVTLGVSLRAFTFQRDLTDGYFDPDFYGIGELNARWLKQPAPWSLLVELAPGIQKVTSQGDPAATFRGSARIGYRLAPGRELSVSGGYSTTGLQSFSTGGSGYRYTALIVGVDWTF